MNAHDSLLDNFSSMQDEFNSSNNRSTRAIDSIFEREIKDLEESLDYFNCEYLVVDKRKLKEIIKSFSEKITEAKKEHIINCQRNFDKEVCFLKQSMCKFFELKLSKGDNAKKKISCEVKKVFDKMCDFNFIGFEEELDTIIYNFKVNFEMGFIRDEYCKDDFNKIIRSFEHSLIENLRSQTANAVTDKQEIFSRYATKGYDILEGYKNKKR